MEESEPVKHLIGPIILEFRERGHRVSMTFSEGMETLRRINDETEMLEGVEVPRTIELTTSGGADPDMHARVELRDGSPVLTELSWKSAPGQTEIRPKHLRQTDISKLVTDLVMSTIPLKGVPPLSNPDALTAAAVRERQQLIKQSSATVRRFVERQRLPRARRVMTPEFLQSVAAVYRENIEGKPTKAVSEMFNVQSRQASKYVDAARRRGYLPKTVRGQKKA
ncbi:hypothetical protein NGTWS0302_16820 [Mycolicibacterium cyprinidarum]|uniref:Uncharacterized protein n=1 Tax=Mycolicibacterium cyprinidarum TaxID=2860311 RepID=A0ABQ4VFB3_9MYCO|nr:hypothetical protein NGTWS1702_24730 [Mycolicibacterium sp. NGTWSNA01]GJF18523.1 hypothetical protein NGTWS0302_16820 [Mycolicibacterium sp. NGTWS0302]